MQGGTYLIFGYGAIWVGLMAYLGWIALRLRGVRTEVETVRALAEEQEKRRDA